MFMTLYIALFTTWVGCCDEPAASNEAIARNAVLACQNNVEQFRRYYCKWRLTRAEAKDQKAGQAGLYSNQRHCEFSIAADIHGNKMERYQCFAPNPDTRNAVRAGDKLVTTIEFLPGVELRGGDDSARLTSGVWNDVRLRSRQYWHQRQEPMPMSLGEFYGDQDRNSPFTLLREYQEGKTKLSSNGNVMLDGRPLIHVMFARGWGEWVFYLDPQQGYLPYFCEWTYIDSRDGKRRLMQIARVVEAKEHEGKGWFPTRVVSMWVPDKAEKPVSVSDLQVREFRLDDEVKVADFEMDLPAGTAILRDMPEDQYVSFKLRQREVITPNDLPKLNRLLDETKVQREKQATARPVMDTAIPRRETPWLTYSLLAGGVGLAAGAAVVAFRRRRLIIERSPESLPGTG